MSEGDECPLCKDGKLFESATYLRDGKASFWDFECDKCLSEFRQERRVQGYVVLADNFNREPTTAVKRDSLECIAEQTRNNEALRVRAEKAEAELAEAIEQRDNAHAAMLAYEADAHRTAYAEAKLSKREKALHQATGAGFIELCVCGDKEMISFDGVCESTDTKPELAEWLKSRRKK